MKIRAEFATNLHSFLITEGYTHVYNIGIRQDEDDYLLEPLKPDDARLTYDDTGMHIEQIDDNDVKEMASGIDLILFMALVDTAFLRNTQNCKQDLFKLN